jgi:putative two-component system response regulator
LWRLNDNIHAGKECAKQHINQIRIIRIVMMTPATLELLLQHVARNETWLALFLSEFKVWRIEAPSLDDRNKLDDLVCEKLLESEALLTRSRLLASDALSLIFAISVSQLARLNAEKAIPLVRLALTISNQYNLVDQRRRAHNVLAALQLATGETHAALHHALASASLARMLDRPDALVNALLNATLALTHLGLYRETIEIAMKTELTFCTHEDCAEDIALLLGNAAHAANMSGQHSVALMFSNRALAKMSQATDIASAIAFVNVSITRLKSAIELGQKLLIDDCMLTIRTLGAWYPSLRLSLMCRFAEALYVGYAQRAFSFVLTELAIIRESARDLRDLFLEVSQQLIQHSLSLGDDAGVAFHVSQLVDSGSASKIQSVLNQVASIERSLDTQPGAVVVPNAFRLPSTSQLQCGLPRNAVLRGVEQLAISAALAEDASGRSVYRVGKLVFELALALGYSGDEASTLEKASRLHDIGKLVLPSTLIAKPHLFSIPEFEAMQAHTEFGATLLEQFGHPFFSVAACISRHHHETWEGTGYPDQLVGNDIPEVARIVAICDIYDSLTHKRTDRDVYTHAEAVEHITRCAGTDFDPSIAKVFISVIGRLHREFGADLSHFLASAKESDIDESMHQSMLKRYLGELVPESLFDTSIACGCVQVV